MVVHNPNNWHWVDKNCLPWSKKYFETELINVETSTDDFNVLISSVNGVTGDCDVSQRKGKVLCIYDMTLTLSISGKKDGDEFTGTISIPELIHDQDEQDYIFNIDSEHKFEIKTHLIPVLKEKLIKFQPDLIKAHEAEIQNTAL